MTCLQRLLHYLQAGFLPQYFLIKHNLLDPKIRGETRRRLLRIVSDLVSEGWECVLRCPLFMETEQWLKDALVNVHLKCYRDF